MSHRFDRRQFVRAVPAFGLLPLSSQLNARQEPVWPAPLVLPPPVDEAYPSQSPALAKEIVTVSHGNLARVRELVGKYPALANASWDWGFGDWETALGASSHVGNRAIAEFLIENGAGPTIFSAAMLGQFEAVKAFATSFPNVRALRGPHGITLLAHAKAGGANAAAVVSFLESLGSDTANTNAPLTVDEQNAIAGTYSFGSGPRDRFVVDVERNQLGIARIGATRRGLVHLGGLEFHPVGAPAVRLRFAREGALVTALNVQDGDAILRAPRDAATR